MQNSFIAYRYVRLALVILAIGICIWTIKATATFGISRMIGKFATVTLNSDVARTATQLTPNDAQSRRTAAALASLNDPSEASIELEKAVLLRPSDYLLWLELGITRDRLGDTAGAISAFDEAIKRAPFYAQPPWLRGNVLLRSGQYEAGFNDLNRAVQSNPQLIPKLLDLAWSISNRDPNLTEKFVPMRSPALRVAFAKLLAREGKPQEAVAQFQAAGVHGGDLKREMVQQLLAQRAFSEAYSVWRSGDGSAVTPAALIYDGGFEGSLVLNEAEFGWRLPGTVQGVSLSSDATDKHSGSKSLLIEFQGNANASSPLLSQLVIVEPSRHYRLNLAARSKNIVTGGPPMAAVRDAADQKILGQSLALNKSGDAWRVYSVEFETPANASAILITIEREPCTTSPCPIFGSLAVDSFSLELVK